MALSISNQVPEITLLKLVDGTAGALASACAQLLDFVDRQPEPLRMKYRLELRPGVDGQWVVKVRLDYVPWFDAVSATVGPSAAIAAGKKFITQTRNEIKNRPVLVPPTNTEVIPNMPTENYCMNADCTHKRMCTKGLHPQQWCQAPVGRGNVSRKCGFFIKTHLLLPGTVNNSYMMGASIEHIRDILFAPFAHQTNSHLARDSGFWSVVLQQLSSIASVAQLDLVSTIEGVAFNMGKWENQGSDDLFQYSRNSHGHVHFLLTVAGVSSLYTKPRYIPLTGRFRDHDGYLEPDCRELETTRLLPVEGELLRAEVGLLKGEMADVKGQLAAILGLLRLNHEKE